jgi:preprotein translocase subunit SecE
MARTPRRRAENLPRPAAATSTTADTHDAAAKPARAPRRAGTNLPRPASAPISVPREAPRIRRNPLAFLRRLRPRFLADIIAELKKVTWPSFNETRYLTAVVIIVAVAVGFILGGVDIAFGWIIEKLFFD